jgi:membrane glycosyltransferase
MLAAYNKTWRTYKMRKNLILGSLLAVFLMMMLPTVAATEAKVAQSASTSPNLLDAQTTYIEAIREKYKDNPSPQTFIILSLAILFLKLLRWGAIIVIGAIFLVIIRMIRGQNTTSAVGC